MSADGVLHNGRWRSAVLASERTSTAKIVACAIAEHGWSTGAIFPDQETLQELSSLKRTAVRDGIAELQVNGWLVVTPGSGRAPSLYGLTSPVEIAVDEPRKRVARRGAEGRRPTPRGSADDPQRVGRRPRRSEELPEDSMKDSAGAHMGDACACGRGRVTTTEGVCTPCRSERLAGEHSPSNGRGA